jgi:hypothetical protein
MLKTVLITADGIGDRHCAGCGFFAFCFFFAIADPVGSGPSDRTRTLPSGLSFEIVERIVSRGASEVHKAKGKPKMTLYDGLRIGWRDF